MSEVRIVTDSACDLPAPLAASLGIEIVPLTVRFADQEFVDRIDLTPAEFWARCAASSVLPETAAPPPGAFEETFRRLAAEGAPAIVCVTLSSALSATMQSAQVAARAVADEVSVEVVDSRSVTMGLGMIAVAAARLAHTGADVGAIVDHVGALVRRTRVFGTLDTLENLKKGGRIGAAQALLGSVLSVKPAIEVRDGAVEPGPKQRTRARALAWLADKVAADKPVGDVAIISGEAPDVDVLKRLLSAHVPEERMVLADLGAVVGTHAGPRTIGVAYQVA